MAKKIKKGNPLTELVKGSLEYTLAWISSQFRSQFPYVDSGPNFYVVDSFADFVTVESYSSELMPSEFYKVTYTRNGDQYTFAPRDEWEIVELAYQPATRASEMAALESKPSARTSPPAPLASTSSAQRPKERGEGSNGKKRGRRFEEVVFRAMELTESEEQEKPNGPWRIKATGITADIINGNGRRYPAAVLDAAVKELNTHLHESAGQGRMLSLTGESDHPADKGHKRPLLKETVFNWDKVTFDGQSILLEGNLLGTSAGKDIHAQMRGGVRPGISQRGYGESKKVKVNDVDVEEITQLIITGYDATPPGEQSDPNGGITYFESQQGDDMNIEELLKLLKDHPELFQGVTEAQVKAMGDAQLKALEARIRSSLGIDEGADIAEALKATADKARKFDESQKKSAIDAAKAEAVKDLPFGDKLNPLFIESINEAEFPNPEAVQKFAESLRKQYSKMAASGVLKGMGFDEKTRSVKVIGDVLERETGTPEFARTSFELIESVRKHDNRAKRAIDERSETAAAVLTAKILERFDRVNQAKLTAESRLFSEAELTTDLNLPYSVSRVIIAEAFPNLVAAGIFDVDTIETSPTRLYYETFAGESGYAGTATDEVEAGGAEEVWYNLSHGRIDPDSVVVTSNPAGTTYEEGVDYVINYADGKIKFLEAGSVGANDVLVDYTYSSVRNGENQPIERAKTTLAYKTIEAAADRLADQITSEAIVFSRSQLGWDAVARTMASLVRQIRRKIDQGLLYMAFSAVKAIPNNATDPWTVGTAQADLAELVRLMGNASVIVAGRYYEPTYFLASVTRADGLSNWEGFKRDGFPNAVLNAAGFAGGVKGKPIFASTEFPDSLIIAGNRELVQHRVFQPLTIKGPFPSYAASGDTTRLIAAEQYYAEEYNATESLVHEKGAYVPIEEAGS